MFHLILPYFKFLIHSTNQHGVHSPFVFHLVTKCFYDYKKKPEYGILKKLRNQLYQNKKTIDVTDFGAGSRVFKSNTRPINKIAKTAGITPKRAQLLYRLAQFTKPQSVLEIGTSLGLATSALALGNSNSDITTLEGCPETSRVAQNIFKAYSINNITPIISEFNLYLDTKIGNSKFDLIYFDGNHSKEATISYFEKLLATTTNDSIWIFDDIHWSKPMEEAWQHIKQHNNVTVSIDTFQWGIISFRKEQEKEHFTIRI